mmetsp:Transcript_6320/g.17353  ORF Transcript_6320/g.17353 Transcript_6320/m.17353 type:complete len:222 (-) Transcript_6320:1153-1818(-)
MILAKAVTARSASFEDNSHSMPVVRQMTRKVSPLFLLGAPWNSSVTPCTISATWFTKFITSVCSTSVTMLKSWMRTLPMTQSTRRPATMAQTEALCCPRMFWVTMFAPASPKPSTSREPSLMIVLSSIKVSIGSVGALGSQAMTLRTFLKMAWARSLKVGFGSCFIPKDPKPQDPSPVFEPLRLPPKSPPVSFLNSSSAIWMAVMGLSRMVCTREIIVSTG